MIRRIAKQRVELNEQREPHIGQNQLDLGPFGHIASERNTDPYYPHDPREEIKDENANLSNFFDDDLSIIAIKPEPIP